MELYFYSPHDMCFAWSVLYDLSLWFLVYHNHPCCTHLLGDTHMNRDLLEYSMCFTYIFWARQYCSSASLISFRARRWLNFVEIVNLSCFTYIILRVFYNNMVFSMVIKLVLEWWASKLGIIKTIIESELDVMINLILDNCFEIWRYWY